MVYISNSVKETHSFAKQLLKSLSSNLICLYGELGSGKTTFVQGLARALGIKKRVLSPTFILIREYPLPKFSTLPAGRQVFNFQFSIFTHIDCYRIDSEENIKSIDLKEIWSNSRNLVVIEWAERIKKILPKRRVDVKFEYLGENKRKIEKGLTLKRVRP